MRGDETIRTSTGDLTAPCSADLTAVVETEIVVKLATSRATRTLTTVACAPGQQHSAGNATPTTTITASSVDVTTIANAVRALRPDRGGRCLIDGDTNQLTIAYDDGTTDVLADDQGPGCAPTTGTIPSAAMAHVLELTNALF